MATNYEKIISKDIDEMAAFLENGGWGCTKCPEDERLSDNPLLKNERCDEQCRQHCRDWLEKEAE